MLSGDEIKRNIGKDIIIRPYNEEQLNPNSYNLTLDNELMVYTDDTLDAKKKNNTKKIIIPDEGYVLHPGELYLAKTYEYTETHSFVPVLFGRSSTGRLGLTVHITAGFGDVGFSGYWTLQLTCVKPIKIYPYMKICQVAFFPIEGAYSQEYHSKYQNNNEIQSSLLYKELGK